MNRILFADDSLVYRKLLKEVADELGYEALVAMDGREAWEILQRPDAPRLVVLDWIMPEMDGDEICRRLRADKNLNSDPLLYKYIILLTGMDSRDDIITGFEAGADDYILKPFHAGELKMRLRVGMRILTIQDRFYFAATHDALTGLFHRGTIIKFLNDEMGRTKHNNKAVAVVLLDLDHFKRVNDTYGHSAGDCVLRETAGRLQAAGRAEDCVGRFGGEEFLLVLPGWDDSQAEVCERIRRAVADREIVVGRDSITVTASIGVAVYQPGQQMALDELIKCADQAMYQAKDQGRNQVVYFTGN